VRQSLQVGRILSTEPCSSRKRPEAQIQESDLTDRNPGHLYRRSPYIWQANFPPVEAERQFPGCSLITGQMSFANRNGAFTTNSFTPLAPIEYLVMKDPAVRGSQTSAKRVRRNRAD
jgi:hypothetical protein